VKDLQCQADSVYNTQRDLSSQRCACNKFGVKTRGSCSPFFFPNNMKKNIGCNLMKKNIGCNLMKKKEKEK
jgi:hypothetical protein